MTLPKPRHSKDKLSFTSPWSIRYLVFIVLFVVAMLVLNLRTSTSSSKLSSPLRQSLLTQQTRGMSQMDRRVKYQYHPPQQRNKGQQIECGASQESYATFFKLNDENRSRYNEDKSIYTLFFQDLTPDQMKDYHYIEIGAFDGMRESNTRFFDECLGWSGLLIEPNPRIFPRLVQNRIYAHRMSYATSCSEIEERMNKTVTFYASLFTNAAEDLSDSREAYAKSNLAIEVPCGSLSPAIIDLFPSKRIHFFSLDVEGMEYQVLQHIDFNNVFIDIIMAESVNPFCQEVCEAREKVRSFMKSKGYLLYSKTIPDSDLFVHSKSEFGARVPTQQKLLK
jgi:FkbM family methyltransferase